LIELDINVSIRRYCYLRSRYTLWIEFNKFIIEFNSSVIENIVMKIRLPLILGFDQMSDCQLLKNVLFMDCADTCCECFICVEKKSQKKISPIWVLFLAVTERDFPEQMNK